MSRRHLLPPLLIAIAAIFALPAAGDWLVMKDGSQVETKGPWKVDGRRVIFTLPNGTLSAMRASEVDFEASEAATSAVLAPEPEPESAAEVEEPRPEPVLVLTNKDIGPSTAPDPNEEPQPEVLPSIADREPVQLITWRRYDVEEGVELRGTVRNTGSSVAANINVQAMVKDEQGAEIATGNAFLSNRSLVSGRSSTFRVVLPDVDDFFGDPEFRISSTRITVGGSARSRNQRRSAAAVDDDSQGADGEAEAGEGAGDGAEGSGEEGDEGLGEDERP